MALLQPHIRRSGMWGWSRGPAQNVPRSTTATFASVEHCIVRSPNSSVSRYAAITIVSCFQARQAPRRSGTSTIFGNFPGTRTWTSRASPMRITLSCCCRKPRSSQSFATPLTGAYAHRHGLLRRLSVWPAERQCNRVMHASTIHYTKCRLPIGYPN